MTCPARHPEYKVQCIKPPGNHHRWHRGVIVGAGATSVEWQNTEFVPVPTPETKKAALKAMHAEVHAGISAHERARRLARADGGPVEKEAAMAYVQAHHPLDRLRMEVAEFLWDRPNEWIPTAYFDQNNFSGKSAERRARQLRDDWGADAIECEAIDPAHPRRYYYRLVPDAIRLQPTPTAPDTPTPDTPDTQES